MLPRIHACLAAILAASFATGADAASTRLLNTPAANIALFSASCDIHVLRRPGQIKATNFKIFIRNTGALPIAAGTKLKVNLTNLMTFGTTTLAADLAPGAEIEDVTIQGEQPKGCTVTKL